MDSDPWHPRTGEPGGPAELGALPRGSEAPAPTGPAIRITASAKADPDQAAPAPDFARLDAALSAVLAEGAAGWTHAERFADLLRRAMPLAEQACTFLADFEERQVEAGDETGIDASAALREQLGVVLDEWRTAPSSGGQQ